MKITKLTKFVSDPSLSSGYIASSTNLASQTHETKALGPGNWNLETGNWKGLADSR